MEAQNKSKAYVKELGVTRQTLYNWIEKGWVKPKRGCRNYPVFTKDDIEGIKH